MTIGDRIKKVRKAVDLTQQEFGNRIKLKQNSVALIESGRNTSNQTILSICREFNVNEIWLRTGNGEMFNEQNTKNEISRMVDQFLARETSSFKKRLIGVLSTLKEDQWLLLERKAKELIAEEKEESPQEPTQLTLEQEADAFAAKAREQFLLEKKRESQASSVKKSDVG